MELLVACIKFPFILSRLRNLGRDVCGGSEKEGNVMTCRSEFISNVHLLIHQEKFEILHITEIFCQFSLGCWCVTFHRTHFMKRQTFNEKTSKISFLHFPHFHPVKVNFQPLFTKRAWLDYTSKCNDFAQLSCVSIFHFLISPCFLSHYSGMARYQLRHETGKYNTSWVDNSQQNQNRYSKNNDDEWLCI